MSDYREQYKLILDGFTEMDACDTCMSCGSPITEENIIGWGSYPVGGFRWDRYKPLGIAVECPICFLKQCHHALFGEGDINDVIRVMENKNG